MKLGCRCLYIFERVDGRRYPDAPPLKERGFAVIIPLGSQRLYDTANVRNNSRLPMQETKLRNIMSPQPRIASTGQYAGHSFGKATLP